jgi:hypothetical protein
MSDGSTASAGLGSSIAAIPIVGWFYHVGEAIGSGSLWSAGTGTVSPTGKQGLIDEETQTLIQAGMDAGQAAIQAESDVTSSLTQAGADPSQAGLPDWVANFGDLLTLLLIVFICYVVIQIFVFKKPLSEVV